MSAGAQVRTRVRVPLRLAGGFAVTADVFTFRDLVDGRVWTMNSGRMHRGGGRGSQNEPDPIALRSGRTQARGKDAERAATKPTAQRSRPWTAVGCSMQLGWSVVKS